METRSKKSVAIVLLAIIALTVTTIPSFAAPASQHYQVSTNKKVVQPGQSVMVTATIKQATPNCAYSVLLTVTGPGGVSATDAIVVNTQAGGNGHTSVTFPDDFSGTANTNTAGTYSVSATFTCGYYATGAASSMFTVSTPGPQHYQVTTKKVVQPGQSVRVIATTIRAVPNCAYSVLLTVTGPGGVSATDSVTINTGAGGNGLVMATFPDDFSGTANTNTAGTYTVSATFTCGYATGAASSMFTVPGPGPQHYQLITERSNLVAGQSVRLMATTTRAVPNCAYSVLLTVTGPGGVSATDTITVNTGDAGNGRASATFPDDFSGTANTNTAGTYSVSATFTCGYATGAASSIFTVFK